MGKPISLFSGYSQKENRITNYCLLILKMLYEENPKHLGEALTSLIGEDVSTHIGVVFRQQEPMKRSVPDGLIIQSPVTVYIETKNYDWFYDEQLASHIFELDKQPGKKVLLALGKFDTLNVNRFEKIQSLCKNEYNGSVIFRAVSFEDFLNAVNLPKLTKNLADTVEDFKDFLNEEDLLSSWEHWLDVVNCAGSPEEIIDHGVYMCPAKGGAYNHDRCRFFGMYRNKCVEKLAEIQAVVDVDLENALEQLKWKNISGNDDVFKKLAKEKVHTIRPGAEPTRVFLLGNLFDTNFIKNSAGGMQQSKQYFNISSLKAPDANMLAQQLNGRVWSDFK